VTTIASLVGLSERPVGAEEVPWAVRRFVEAIAAEQALVLLIEDLHWAEAALLDLLIDLAQRVRGPVLLLGTARPELLDARPEWPGVVHLDVLGPAETRALVSSLPEASSQQQSVVTASGGNPLFAEELSAFLAEQPKAAATPPTLAALLAARLDALAAPERAAAERGAVEGEQFHERAVLTLSAEQDRTAVERALKGLRARDFIRPAPAGYMGGAAFRFKHALVRDAAYAGMTKRLRAQLHERLADWLEERAGQRSAEIEEIVGYHLEQTYRYLTELGVPGQRGRSVAMRGGKWLASAGRHALGRGDLAAAANLLGRARDLLPKDKTASLELLPLLGDALSQLGELSGANEILDEAIKSAGAAGERAVELRARIDRAWVRLFTDPEGGTDELLREVEAAMPVLEELQDEAALARAWWGMSEVHHNALRWEARLNALERSRVHAERAGDEQQVIEARMYICVAAFAGPTPASEVAELRERWSDVDMEAPRFAPGVLTIKAGASAMLGQVDVARRLLARARALSEELGLPLRRLNLVSEISSWVEMNAGDPEAAEREAERYVAVAQSTGASDDVITQAMCRQVRAKVLARGGNRDEAGRLAQEAVALMEPTDALDMRADGLVDLAEVLRLCGRPGEAVESLHRAIRLYERKEHLVGLRRARTILTELD